MTLIKTFDQLSNGADYVPDTPPVTSRIATVEGWSKNVDKALTAEAAFAAIHALGDGSRVFGPTSSSDRRSVFSPMPTPSSCRSNIHVLRFSRPRRRSDRARLKKQRTSI